MAERRLTVRDAMTTTVVAIQEDATVTDLIALLNTHMITGAPVVNRGGTLVGIVTKDDILQAELLARPRPSAPTALKDLFTGGFTPTAASPGPSPERDRVRDIMTREVVAIQEEMPLREACALMSARRLHRLPVVTNGKLVGILSSFDIVKAVSEGKVAP